MPYVVKFQTHYTEAEVRPGTFRRGEQVQNLEGVRPRRFPHGMPDGFTNRRRSISSPRNLNNKAAWNPVVAAARSDARYPVSWYV